MHEPSHRSDIEEIQTSRTQGASGPRVRPSGTTRYPAGSGRWLEGPEGGSPRVPDSRVVGEAEVQAREVGGRRQGAPGRGIRTPPTEPPIRDDGLGLHSTTANRSSDPIVRNIIPGRADGEGTRGEG